MKIVKSDRKSIKFRLVTAFVVTSIIPILLINIVYYYNTSRLVQQNVESMTKANLEQTKVSLDLWLESYEDILFQVYTDDTIVELVDKINAGEDVANNRKMLRKTLRGLFYTKDYVKSISIITESGEIVFYDQLTGATNYAACLNSIPASQPALYEQISADNKTHLFSTGDKVVFGSNSCYLFHIGHRIIDYLDVKKKCGVVLVSIDERLLEEVCSPPTESGMNFLVDGKGDLVACINSGELGKNIVPAGAGEEVKNDAYRQTAGRAGFEEDGKATVYTVFDEKTGWEVVRVTSQDALVSGLRKQQQMLAFIIALSFVLVLFIMVGQVSRMTGSIERVVGSMRKAGKGDLTVHVAPDGTRPTEIEIIAEEFNSMMDKLKDSTEKQKNAEIAALEAQINPHFLYNTLDTINWMAIDKEEYELSNMIGTLARILRYGISDRGGVVKIREEAEWLKQYIFLQQTRLKNSFACHIDLEPEIMELPVHKLLLQPFVENAILHGFKEMDKECRLQINIKGDGDFIEIEIRDNGCGIPAKIVADMNAGIFRKAGNKNHIGMENAITRIRMYYGERAQVVIESIEGWGTTVKMRIPAVMGDRGED